MTSEAEIEQGAGRAVPPALVALVAPDTGMDRQARVGGAKFAFLVALTCALLAGFAEARKVDSRAATLEKLEQSGQLQTMSDRQLDEETTKSNRFAQVILVGKGVAEAPLFLGLGALSVLGLVWFLRGKLKGRAVVPVAAAALLPSAIANLLDAVTAFNLSSLPIKGAALAPRSLSGIAAALGHPIVAPWVRLGNALDFFSLWAALLMGYGVAAAGDIPLRRAMTGTFVAWACYRLLIYVGIGIGG